MQCQYPNYLSAGCCLRRLSGNVEMKEEKVLFKPKRAIFIKHDLYIGT